MQRRPRERGAPLLSPFLLWRVLLVSVLFAAVTLGIFFYTLDQGRGLEVARTMVVNMFIVAEIFYLFNVRYLHRSEEHTSELQSLMRISYAVFCLQKKNKTQTQNNIHNQCIEYKAVTYINT